MSKKIYIFILTVTILNLTYITPFSVWSLDLTILHTNDIHAHLAGIKEKTGKPCYTSTSPNCIGGVARLAQAILDIRQKTPNTLLLDAGDQFVGTAFYSDFLEMPEKLPFIEFINRLGYAATTPGNHEFDNGCGVFFGAIRKLNVPIIASNLTFSDPTMQSALLPWIIVEREGKRIGIVGLVLEDTVRTSNPCSEAIFSNAELALKNAVKELKEQNVYTIIALSHLGTNVDIELATQVDGVSVIVGGHTHTLLSNTHAGAKGPYPVVKQSPSGYPVLIVTAKERAEYLGRLNVTFDPNGIPQKWEGNPIYLNEPISNDPAVTSIAELLDSYGKPIQDRLEVKVGEISDPNLISFDPSQYTDRIIDERAFYYCRKEECITADIILDALLESGQKNNAQIAMIGTGMIRSSLPVGVVTKLDVATVIPNDNKLYIGDISGQQLQEALEHGVSEVHFVTYMGKFLQVSGLRYSFDPKKPVGQRIQSIEIINKNGQYEPLHPSNTYRVVTNSFVAQGNDGFTMLKDTKWTDTQINVSEAVEEYLNKHSPIQAKKDGRIVNFGPII